VIRALAIAALFGCGSRSAQLPPAPATSPAAADAGMSDAYDEAACEEHCRSMRQTRHCAMTINGQVEQVDCPCHCP
jgi:hypothetical protein